MKRITPQEVLDAYAKTGLKPSRDLGSRWYSDKCACGLGVLLVADGCAEDSGGVVRPGDRIPCVAYSLGLRPLYVAGFTEGFDGKERDWLGEDADQGYSDGLAAAAAVFQGSLER